MRFFAVVNAVKLVPYSILGVLSLGNLKISALLFPVALVATVTGAFVVKRMRPDVFYPFMYLMCALAGLKLAWDGISELVLVF